MNRCEIAGRRIKVEHSRPGGGRRRFVSYFFNHIQYYILILTICLIIFYSLMLQLNHESENDDLHYVPLFSSPTTNSYMSGLASGLNSQAPVSKLAPIGRGQTSSSNVFQQPSHLIQEIKMDNKYHAENLSPSGPLISDGGGIETLSGSEFLWGSPNSRSEPPSNSSVWSTSSSARVHQSVPQNLSHHHNGSAPSSKDTMFMNSAGLNGGSFQSKMSNHGMMNSGGGVVVKYRLVSSPRVIRGPMLLNSGRFTSGFDGVFVNGRRVECQVEIRKQFQLDLEKIMKGEDSRTTLMIKNIPNK